LAIGVLLCFYREKTLNDEDEDTAIQMRQYEITEEKDKLIEGDD